MANHPSIEAIKENTPEQGYSSFNFKPVDQSLVSESIKKLNPKKATGVDQLPAKLIKAGSIALAGPIITVFNLCARNNQFPNDLKSAQVRPIYKKMILFVKKNYRPVSILTAHSKIFEDIMFIQLTNSFHNYLAAFRKGFGCATTLLRLAEDWKKDLNKQQYVGAVLMDISKAFDCLPHDFILAELSAYGLSANACDFLNIYLSNRKQRVKVGQFCSSWLNITRFYPWTPFLNIFMNDIFYFKRKASIYNYADDNTVSCSHKNLDIMREVLVDESAICIDWFRNNKMQANPDKFQAIMLGKSGFENCKSLFLNGTEIKCEDF